MTPAGALLAAEIERSGPISFHRFMEVALYHPEHGYYRRGRDPFGKRGDYYTAEQVQPVFGILMASLVGSLAREFGAEREFHVVELGAGRAEMREFLSAFRYTPVEIGERMPDRIRGLVFANEFFDALPVHVAVKHSGAFHEMLVGLRGQNFVWVEGPPVGPGLAEYLDRFAGRAEDGTWVEAALDALAWIDEVSRRLADGWLLVIDYGYTPAELVRFPAGTLMSYSRHVAIEDVLARPGERDITAHVPFTALQERATQCGFTTLGLEALARTLLRIGESDQFARALAATTEIESIRRRLQLKALLYGMGESFRTLLLAKRA